MAAKEVVKKDGCNILDADERCRRLRDLVLSGRQPVDQVLDVVAVFGYWPDYSEVLKFITNNLGAGRPKDG